MVKHYMVRAFAYDIGCITVSDEGYEFSKYIPENITGVIDASNAILGLVVEENGE